MHPNRAFHWEDRDELRAFAAEIGFGQLFAATPEGPRVAQLPHVWQDDSHIRFHIARGNALTRHLDGATALYVVSGPDAYISPDWYGTGNQVPTWNYLAVELEGPVRKISDDELIEQIEALSDANEARLAPKPSWTIDKMQQGYFDTLLRGIMGFEMKVTAWRGTAKLGQHKAEPTRLAVADALEAQGHDTLANWTRNPPTGGPS